MLRRRPSGFALVFSIVIAMVMVLMATAVVLRMVTDLRTARTVSRQVATKDDADVALRLAETEILGSVDRMLLAVWSSNEASFSNPAPLPGHYTASSSFKVSELDVHASYPGTDAASKAKHRPLLQMTLLGNPRNWPFFCDWSKYKTDKWDGQDKDLTRYWRYVPRDNVVDDDWFAGASITGFPVILNVKTDPVTKV